MKYLYTLEVNVVKVVYSLTNLKTAFLLTVTRHDIPLLCYQKIFISQLGNETSFLLFLPKPLSALHVTAWILPNKTFIPALLYMYMEDLFLFQKLNID